MKSSTQTTQPTKYHRARDVRLEQGIRHRDNIKKRTRSFALAYPNPVNQDQLTYGADVLIGAVTQLIDELDKQRKSLARLPLSVQKERTKQWDRSCGFEREQWSKCLNKLNDLVETQTKYPAITRDHFQTYWEQLRWTWTTADDKITNSTPKLR